MQTVWIEQFYSPSKYKRPARLPLADVEQGIIQAMRDGCTTASEIGKEVGRTRKVITVRLHKLVADGVVVHVPKKSGLVHHWILK